MGERKGIQFLQQPSSFEARSLRDDEGAMLRHQHRPNFSVTLRRAVQPRNSGIQNREMMIVGLGHQVSGEINLLSPSHQATGTSRRARDLDVSIRVVWKQPQRCSPTFPSLTITRHQRGQRTAQSHYYH